MQFSKRTPKMALITGAALVASTAAVLSGVGMASATTRPARAVAAPATLPAAYVQSGD
jgi:NAD(P)H-hydrate repair Nnr-like enzyme with NAD(P)H-hydrate dehydratase domain